MQKDGEMVDIKKPPLIVQLTDSVAEGVYPASSEPLGPAFH